MDSKKVARKIIEHSGIQVSKMFVHTLVSLKEEEYPYEFADFKGDRNFWKKVLIEVEQWED